MRSSIGQAITAKVSATHAELRRRHSSIRHHVGSQLDLLASTKQRDAIARLGLAALLIPILILMMTDRIQSISKGATTARPAQPHPGFNLETRLSFAEPLRNELLAQAISASLGKEPQQKNTEAGSTREAVGEPQQTEAVAAPSPLSLDGQETWDRAIWRFPFNATGYLPVRLPATAAESFRAEAQLAIFTDDKDKITAAGAKPAEPATAKKHVLEKRKRAVTQQRRAHSPGQMTVSASRPPAMPPQPNLPPPPILFFLGFPPPANANPP